MGWQAMPTSSSTSLPVSSRHDSPGGESSDQREAGTGFREGRRPEGASSLEEPRHFSRAGEAEMESQRKNEQAESNAQWRARVVGLKPMMSSIKKTQT